METSEIMIEVRLLRTGVAALKEELHRYRGFMGGVMWCSSALAAFAGFVWGVVSAP